MIEEIGEIVYTLVIGYIGALELCFVAKHIYHMSHQCTVLEDEETRIKELNDLQEQLKKAVTDSEENLVEGYQVMKDGVLYKDGYRVNTEEQPLKRSKRQIDSNQLLNSSNSSIDDNNILEQNTNNQKNLNEIPLQLNNKNEKQLDENAQSEEKIIQNKIGKNESQIKSTGDKNENNENFNQNKSVDVSAANNNEINSFTSKEFNDTQNNDARIADNVPKNIIDDGSLMKNLNEDGVLNESIKVINSNEEATKNKIKLDDNNKIINNESIDKISEQIENKNFNIESLSSSSNKSHSDEKLFEISSDDQIENLIKKEKISEQFSNKTPSYQIDNLEEYSEPIVNLENTLLEKNNQISQSLETEIPLNYSEADSIFNPPSSLQSELENNNLENIETPLYHSDTSRSPILAIEDSESSGDEEENSIASVIEKKIMTKTDDPYKIILTEEEKDLVINSKYDDMKFKNLSDVLNATEVIRDDVVETLLQDEAYGEDMKLKESQAMEDLSNYYDDEYSNQSRPLRRSPRMTKLDHQEELWDVEENELQKRKDINENFIAAEKAADIDANTKIEAEKEAIREADTKAMIEDKKNAEREAEKEAMREAEIQAEKEAIREAKIQAEEEKAMREDETLTEKEIEISREEVASSSTGKLNLDIVKDIISKDQQLTPTIELFNESGQKSPAINFDRNPPFTPSSDIMEGLSDFYDFNASINPSRSRSVSRSSSVQPLETASPSRSISRSPSVQPLDTASASSSRPISPVGDDNSPTTKLSPNNVENLSDFYDFNVNMNRKIYPKKLSYENEIFFKSSSSDTTADDFIISESILSMREESQRITSPNFNHIFRELKLLSDKSVSLWKETSNIISNDDESPDILTDSIQLNRLDPHFIRSNYVGESTDYSYDFEELREQTRHFIRSRSPSVSFDDNVKPICLDDYRKEIQNNILKELEEKSLNSSIDNNTFVERERRESDSALIKKTEIIFQIQDEPDIIASHRDYDVFEENIEVEPEEYHHFRRFSLQQDYQVDEYPNDTEIYMDENLSKFMNSEYPEGNNYTDNTIDIKDISNDDDQSKEIIFKVISENVTSESNQKLIDETDDVKNNISDDIINDDILKNDNLDQVDLTYVPKKEYNWRKNFKIEDDDETEDKSPNTKSGYTEINKDENNDWMMKTNESHDKKHDNESTEVSNNLDFENTILSDNDEEIQKNNSSENIDKHNNELEEEVVEDDLQEDEIKTKDKILESENIFNKKIDSSIELETLSVEEECCNDEDAIELTNFNIGNNYSDINQDVNNDNGIDSNEINMQNNLNIVENLNNDNGNISTDDDDDNPDTIVDPDDGIDEVIYDYNERPDESYNQSEYGENNNYDNEEYQQARANELQQSLEDYNYLRDNNESDDNIYNENNNSSTESLDNTIISSSPSNLEEKENLMDTKSENLVVNSNLEIQFEKMYDDFIKDRRESRIQKDYDGIVEKMNTTNDDDDGTSSTATDEMIEKIYFKDLSPSRYERLGSEDSFCSNYSSLSQGSFSTRSKYKGISHARQIKSDRLRTRYGIAPAIGKFANFENVDDISVSYIPRKEYNWRKNFKLDDFEDVDIERKNHRLKKRENDYENIDNNVELNGNENVYVENKLTSDQLVEGILNTKIDRMYDDVLKSRRKSRIDKEFAKITEEIELKTEDLLKLDTISTDNILEDILIDTKTDSSCIDVKETIEINENEIEIKDEKQQETESISKKLKTKKKVRRSSTASLNKTENVQQILETNQNSEIVEKPKRKKSLRKSSIASTKNDGEDNVDGEIKIVKKIKKIKKRQSIDNSETATLNTINTNSDFMPSLPYHEMPNSMSFDIKMDTNNTPNESVVDDSEKYSNSSISNSTISLRADDLRDQNDLMMLSSQVRLDRIAENDILELIRDSSILGSSF